MEMEGGTEAGKLPPEMEEAGCVLHGRRESKNKWLN